MGDNFILNVDLRNLKKNVFFYFVDCLIIILGNRYCIDGVFFKVCNFFMYIVLFCFLFIFIYYIGWKRSFLIFK